MCLTLKPRQTTCENRRHRVNDDSTNWPRKCKKDQAEGTEMPSAQFQTAMPNPSADEIIQDLESRGLGWSLDHTGNLIEARIWKWPNVIGRYRPNTVEPLAQMLGIALQQVDLNQFPTRLSNAHGLTGSSIGQDPVGSHTTVAPQTKSG